MKILKDKDADIELIRDKSIVIVGYGNQGTAFAQNLRDSGLNVSVSLKEGSSTIRKATADGFPVVSNEGTCLAGMILMMIPDHLHGEFFDAHLKDKLRRGQMLVFAHGYSIHFGLIKPPKGIRCLLVAPHGPGADVRSRFVEGSGLSCFIASYPVNSGTSLRYALAIAKACGCTRAGAFKTTFEHEAVGDLFGEQALLCGGLTHLLMAVFDTLVRNGIPKENAYLETAHQLELLASLIREGGVTGMFRKISQTAQFGTVVSEYSIANRKLLSELQKLYDDVASGRFARKWMQEYRSDYPAITEFERRIESSSFEKTSAKMRNMFDERKQPTGE
jgi:ketol-acid reductoisomerase